MRAILAVAIAATFVLVFGPWWNHLTKADAGQNVAKSVSPIVTTLNPADMPAQQYP
jgi:hypothetical protein